MVLVSDTPGNDMSMLQTTLGHREGHEASRIGPEALPLDQHIAGGHGAREPCVHILPHPVHYFLAVPDERQHGEHRLDEQTVLPLAALTQCASARIARRRLAG